jgi:hypothetical protein
VAHDSCKQRIARLALAVLALAACHAPPGAAPAHASGSGGAPTIVQAGSPSRSNMETLIRELNLNPQAPTETGIDQASDKLREKKFRGILLIAPEKVALDRDVALPVMGFDVYESQSRGGAGFSENAVAIVTRLEDGETHAAMVYTPKDDQPPPKRVVPPIAATVVGRFSSDLKEQIPDLPWRPGTLAVSVLMLEQRSNPAHVLLSPGAVADADPAVAAYLAQARGPAQPADLIWPPLPLRGGGNTAAAGGYPSYAAEAGTPAVPAGLGVELAIERVVVHRPGQPCVLRGAYRLPVLPRNVVGPGGGGKVGDASATAVARINLVLIGNLDPGPYLLPLRVPAHEPVNGVAAAPVATGSFNIDLFALRAMPRIPQTYNIWAISGDTISGPVPLGLVTPDMLKNH